MRGIVGASPGPVEARHRTSTNSWSFIAQHLPGRTDNEIKNYWNSNLSRRLQTFIRDGETVIIDLGSVPGGDKRRGSNKSLKKSVLTSTQSHNPETTFGMEEHGMILHDNGSHINNLNTSQSCDFNLDVDLDMDNLNTMLWDDNMMEQLSELLCDLND